MEPTDNIDALRRKLLEHYVEKQNEWQSINSSQQYQQEVKFLKHVTHDFIESLRSVAFYSTRGGDIYKNFLTIHAIDDIIQSAIAIKFMVDNGIHNTPKRELRYLIEMMTKYVIVDFDKMGSLFAEKSEYLKSEIPNSSIEIIDSYSPPFSPNKNQEFKSEVKDFFYKACAYVHPSKKQIDEQVLNYNNGNSIGFESAKMFEVINKLIFRSYDLILVMLFHTFGTSMSKDLFEQIFNQNKSWKFHKGKYVKEFIKSFK